MLRRVRVSPFNHIQFVPANIPKAERYNTYIPYYAWQKEQIRPWETAVEYTQKIQTSDGLFLQVQYSFVDAGIINASLKLYSCDGTLVDTFPLEQPSDMPAITDEDGLTYRVNLLNDTEFFQTVDPGRYYFLLEFPFSTAGTTVVDKIESWISEPIELRDSWPDTILAEISNDTNAQDVIFEQYPQRFAFRVEGAIVNPKDLVNRVTAQDQTAQTYPLSADVYNGATFAIGGNGGFVADWVFKKLNFYFTAKYLRLDNMGYTAADGAAITRQYIPDYPLYSGSIDIVESEEAKNYQYTTGRLLILTAPFSDFAVLGVKIGYPGQTVFYYDTPALLDGTDGIALSDYASILDGLISTFGLTGLVVLSGQSIFYELGPGEEFSFAEAVVLEHFFSIRNVVLGEGSAATTLSMAGSNGNNAPYLITTIANTIGSYGQLPDTAQVFNLNPGGVANGTYFNTVYHNGLIGAISISGDTVSNFTGAVDFPEQLKGFFLSDAGKVDQFNIGILNNAFEFLETIQILNCPVLQIVGGYYGGTPWLKLRFIQVKGCVLTTTDVNAFIDEFDLTISAAEQIVYNGLLDLSLQTPPAPPSGAALTTIALLENNYNWSVTTD